MSDQQVAPLSPRVKQYGTDQPLPARRTLRAGPLSAVLEGGDLRYVRVGDRELIRRLYMAVRDRNWGTIEPTYPTFEVDDRGDSFSVRFTAEHVQGEVDFAWTGTIEGTADGTIRYELRGEPRRPFLKNRIGFCVLHPMNLAGVPAMTTTPDGTVEGVFPAHISPHQPFIDMLAIEHEALGEARCRIEFSGDLFEMEDQRNWTDASYKTYSTPLRNPYPVRVEPGTPIEQSVTITLIGTPPAAASTSDVPDIVVGDQSIGEIPPIGYGLAVKEGALSEAEIERLRLVRPAHLWVEVDLRRKRPEWERTLRLAALQSDQLDAPLELSVVGVTAGTVAQLADDVRSLRVPVARVFVFPSPNEQVVFPRSDLDTNREVVALTRAAFTASGLSIPIGGGTRAYFTELNRASGRLPLDELDVATYTINPQIHAFDNASLVETLEAQAVTVASAQAIVGDIPLAIGPVSLRAPFNPNATGPTPEPGPDELPASVDIRQLSLFGAGWTLGSLHRLAESGADSLTFHETVGPRGLMARADSSQSALFPALPGQLFPLYHIFAALADMRGAQLLPVTLADPLTTEALAIRSGNRVRVLVTSFSGEPVTLRFASAGVSNLTLRVLDDESYERAAGDPSFLLHHDRTLYVSRDGRVELPLRPFAVACLTGTVDSTH
jgi:D-apionolactonase